MNGFSRYLRDRRINAAIVVIAILLAGAQGLLWWLGPAPTTHDFIGPPRSGYILHDFTMWSYDVDGLPTFRLDAPRLDRRDGDDSLYISGTPHYQIVSKKPGIPDWYGHSLYAWVDKAGDLFRLQGPVEMTRAPYTDPQGQPVAETVIDTSDVTAWPKENRMQTAEAAHAVQGGRKLNGIGMRANLNDNHLELLDASQGTFPPRPRKA